MLEETIAENRILRAVTPRKGDISCDSLGRAIVPGHIKLAIAIAVASGSAPRKIAEVTGVSQQSIRRYARLARREGVDRLRQARGRPRILTDAQVAGVIEDLQRDPWEIGFTVRTWTLATVAELVERKYGLRVSGFTASRALKQAGYVFKRGGTAVSRSEYRVRARARAMIQGALSSADAEAWFIDEAHFGTTALGQGRWVRKSDEAALPFRLDWPHEGWHVIAGLCQDGRLLSRECQGTTAWKVIMFLNDLELWVGETKPVRIIWDNARCHNGKRTQAWLAKRPHWRVTPLPPWCSYLNPIETVWHVLRRDCMKAGARPGAARAALRKRIDTWRLPNEELRKLIAAAIAEPHDPAPSWQRERFSVPSASRYLLSHGAGSQEGGLT